MMTLFRSRMLGRAVLGALVLSTGISVVAAAQTACPQQVVATTNLGNKLDGQLIGERLETNTTTTTSGTTSGSLSGTASTGTASGTATVGTTSGTTTATTISSTNVGTYSFEDGSRYTVDCSTLMPREKIYPTAAEG